MITCNFCRQKITTYFYSSSMTDGAAPNICMTCLRKANSQIAGELRAANLVKPVLT